MSRLGVCTIEGCASDVRCRGLCSKHYGRWRAHGDPEKTLYRMDDPTCSIEGCDRRHLARGWCSLHYDRWKRHGNPRTVLPAELLEEVV